jgi:UDP-glucuronate 4-epimerase
MEMLPMQSGDVHITSADISNAQEKLGYHPKTSIHDGINRFVKWYESYCAN